MKTPGAHRKMGEAQFFLERLRKDASENHSERSEAFGYYLSAFLGAADSVIDIARKEMQIKKTEFEAWQKSLDEREQDLLYFMIGQRNREIHSEGADVVPTRSRVANTFYPHVEPLSLPAMLRGSIEEGPKDKITGLPFWIRVWIPKTEYRFVKGQDQTQAVLGECANYVALLEKFLSWCEENKERVRDGT